MSDCLKFAKLRFVCFAKKIYITFPFEASVKICVYSPCEICKANPQFFHFILRYWSQPEFVLLFWFSVIANVSEFLVQPCSMNTETQINMVTNWLQGLWRRLKTGNKWSNSHVFIQLRVGGWTLRFSSSTGSMWVVTLWICLKKILIRFTELSVQEKVRQRHVPWLQVVYSTHIYIRYAFICFPFNLIQISISKASDTIPGSTFSAPILILRTFVVFQGSINEITSNYLITKVPGNRWLRSSISIICWSVSLALLFSAMRYQFLSPVINDQVQTIFSDFSNFLDELPCSISQVKK